jgi:hypothetical protein
LRACHAAECKPFGHLAWVPLGPPTSGGPAAHARPKPADASCLYSIFGVTEPDAELSNRLGAVCVASGWTDALDKAIVLLDWSWGAKKGDPNYHKRYAGTAVRVEFVTNGQLARGEHFALICRGANGGTYRVLLHRRHAPVLADVRSFTVESENCSV